MREADRFSDNLIDWLILGGLVLSSLWFAMSLTYPFGWDQGLFAWVGDAIVKGGLPYRDAWDLKGPLTYYVFALAQWLFGVHLWSIRIIDGVALAAAGIGLYRIASPLVDRVFARFATVFFVLWYASHSYWHTAQPDGWVGVLFVIGLTGLLGERQPGPRDALVAGLCFGLAALLKPLWLAFLVLPVLAVHLRRPPRRVTMLAVLGAAWLLPILVTASWFAWQGALDDLVAIHLRYSALYAGLAPESRVTRLAQYVLLSRVTTITLPMAAYGCFVLWKTHRTVAIILATWTVMVMAVVIVQGRFYAYHWLPLLPPMALMAGAGLNDLRVRVIGFVRFACAILLLACAAPIALETGRFVAWIAGALDTRTYYDAYGDPGADLRAVEWLRSQGGSGKVFAFGWHSAVPWLSGRTSVSRFGYSLPLMMGENEQIRDQYRTEVMAALTADPPQYILAGTLSERILGTRTTVADFPEFAALLRQRYREVVRFGPIAIHEIQP